LEVPQEAAHDAKSCNDIKLLKAFGQNLEESRDLICGGKQSLKGAGIDDQIPPDKLDGGQ
jgi:hypothetical protein